MICQPCKDRTHGGCKGSSWCFCQHDGTGTVLTNQQRNDLAVYGVALPRNLPPEQQSTVVQIRPNGAQQ